MTELAVCAHQWAGWAAESELVAAARSGPFLEKELLVRAEAAGEGRARFVRWCRECGALDVYAMTECGHAPWDRSHGSDEECRVEVATDAR